MHAADAAKAASAPTANGRANSYYDILDSWAAASAAAEIVVQTDATFRSVAFDADQEDLPGGDS